MKLIAHQKEVDELKKRVLTYEEYYNADPSKETQNIGNARNLIGSSRRDTKYESFIQDKASKYVFDNDHLD